MRLSAGISLRELAARCELSPSYLSEIELERRPPPGLASPFYKRCAPVLRVDLVDLKGRARRDRDCLMQGVPWRQRTTLR